MIMDRSGDPPPSPPKPSTPPEPPQKEAPSEPETKPHEKARLELDALRAILPPSSRDSLDP